MRCNNPKRSNYELPQRLECHVHDTHLEKVLDLRPQLRIIMKQERSKALDIDIVCGDRSRRGAADRCASQLACQNLYSFGSLHDAVVYRCCYVFRRYVTGAANNTIQIAFYNQ